MLASLLLNLRRNGAGNAIFALGARLTFRPHAPEVTTEYESEQWAKPTGRAPNQTLEIVLDRPATATALRAKPEPAKARQVTVETEWHAAAQFAAGARSKIDHWGFGVDAGQTVDMRGARLQARAFVPTADGGWAVDANVASKRPIQTRTRNVSVSAGASAEPEALYHLALLCNAPAVSGIKNPSPAEIVAMVQAARRARL